MTCTRKRVCPREFSDPTRSCLGVPTNIYRKLKKWVKQILSWVSCLSDSDRHETNFGFEDAQLPMKIHLFSHVSH